MRFSSLLILLVALATSACAENPKDFKVKSAADESEFVLSDNRGKTVVLHFLLKTECPYCLRYTHAFALLAAKSPDAVHVFLKPDSADEIKKWSSHMDKSQLAEQPKIYRDPDAKLASQYEIPDGYKFHGESIHYPALVALDGNGKELFRYVGKSNSDRMSITDFSKKLDAVKLKQSKP